MKRNRGFRSLVWLTLVIFMVTLPMSVAPVQAEPGVANFSIEPSTTNVQQGDIFTINIKVDASAQPVDGAQAYINFDPNYLRVVDVSGNETNQIINGELFNATWPDVLTNTVNNSTGQIDYAAGKGTGGSSANTLFTLATVRFKAITQTGGTPTAIVFNTSAPRATKAAYGLDTVTGTIADGTVIISVASLAPDTTPPTGGGGALPGEAAPPTAEEIGEMTIEEAAEIIEEIAPETAVDIIEEVTIEKAAGIIEEVTTEKAADILEEVVVEKAAAIMEELTTEKLTDIIPAMSETSLTDRLPGLSPAKLYSVEPEVLFDSLPNAPTEQLVSEKPPQPPAEAEAPIVVYTTPSGARYMAIQTWAGEWVVVMGTPPPIDQLMIKTRRALQNVETTLEVLDEQPSGVAVGLPAEQIVRAYITIAFENAAPEDIELGYLTFYVEKEWLEQNSIHKWSVALNRYDPELEQWIVLPTKRVKEDDSYVYYTVVITRFSIFAVSGSQALPPPNFQVANLTINPAKAETGEDITISADITNLSDRAGAYAATLWIDETIEAGKDISLEAGETKVVSFTVTRGINGTYEVRFDRLFSSFSVSEAPPVPPAPAEFVTSNLSIAPAEVDIGKTVAITVLVANTGDVFGSYEVTLEIDNVVVVTKDVTLDGGTSQMVTFTTSKDVAGTYTVDIDGLKGTFTVKAAAPVPVPPKPTNWWLIGGIIAGVIVIGVVIFLVIRRNVFMKSLVSK